MGRRSWWYEVSWDEYESTKTSYGSDIVALDPRLDSGKEKSPHPRTGTQKRKDQQAFSEGKVYPKSQNTPRMDRSAKAASSTGASKKSKDAKIIDKSTRYKRTSKGSSAKLRPRSGQALHAELSVEQKQSIRIKIINLAEMDAVKKFYSSDDKVGAYARKIAPIIFAAQRKKKLFERGAESSCSARSAAVKLAISQKIQELKSIGESARLTQIETKTCDQALNHLRELYRESKENFSTSDVLLIQELKERFQETCRSMSKIGRE